MGSNTSSLHTTTTDRIVFRSVALLVLAIALSACGDGGSIGPAATNTIVSPQAEVSLGQVGEDTTETAGNHTEPGHATGSIEFTDSNDDIWPPQPTGITNIEIIEQMNSGQNDRVKNGLGREKINNIILAQPDLASLLGDNHAWLGTHETGNKTGDTVLTEVEIFSYDTNTLITVSVDEQSANIIDYKVTQASDYQPAESRTEVEAAITLAKVALQKQGFTEYEQLTGTALLAHPSAAEIAESGHLFYSDRKLYVTFGPGNGVLPHYRATVNLSRSIVEDSGAIE